MLVSTTGEDSPQCILDSPAGDPVHYTLQPCRSLNYALKNIRSVTVIGIACGIHVLEPVGSLSHGTPVVNLTIEGACANDLPHIQCTNGTHLAFYNISRIEIKMVSFHGCGEQLQHSARDSVSDSSTLYFQNCKTILIHLVLINITGPYGRGIAVIRHDTSITHGCVFIDSVLILHLGIHGSGLHCEVLTGKTRDISPASDVSLASENILLNNVRVYNERAYPECDPTMAFTGINITVGGDGGGGLITLFNVSTVKSTTRGSGISLALLGRVHGFNAYLKHCLIIEEWENNHRKNSTAKSCKTYEHPSSSTESDESTVYHSTGINIEVKEYSMRNRIYIGSVLVKEHTPVSGNFLSIKVVDQSKDNVITLEKVILLRLNSSGANRRGLQIIVTGWARRNIIQAIGLISQWHKAYWGSGGYVEFSEHATGNLMTIIKSSLLNNRGLRGGGIAVVCKDFANQNKFQFHSNIENSFAEMGGGVYITFQDSAANNAIHLIVMELLNNTAHCGGGMYIQFQGTSVGSNVELFKNKIMENTLLPSKTYDMMGGGVHVDFSTVNATSRTDNTVNFDSCMVVLNSAGQGVGGGISVLYKHSHYHGNSGDEVIMEYLVLFHNTASSGSACSFQSYPTHGKKLFRGIRIYILLAHSIPEFPKMDSDSLHNLTKFYVIHKDLESYFYSAYEQSMETISEQLSRAIFPSFQAKTTTNVIFAKSVQVVVTGKLSIYCVASSQGLYALDSEIVLKADACSGFQHCVATHGGAIALYGESYIRVGNSAKLEFDANHAFQRGGAIYVSSAPGVVPASDCFLLYDQGEENRGVLFFDGNTAKAEGQSVYVSDIRNCFSGRTPKNITTHLVSHPEDHYMFYSSTFVRQVDFTFIYNRTLYDTYYRHHLPLNISQLPSREYRLQVMKREIVSGPYHVSSTTVDWSKPLTLCFTPGKQKRLPYTVVYDELGSNISSVFTVLINKVDNSMPVELDSFSKFTDDFTVILHGPWYSTATWHGQTFPAKNHKQQI